MLKVFSLLILVSKDVESLFILIMNTFIIFIIFPSFWWFVIIYDDFMLILIIICYLFCWGVGIVCFPVCSLDQFLCGSGECIPWKHLCDGYPQCKDASDEGDSCGKNCFLVPYIHSYFDFIQKRYVCLSFAIIWL